MVLKNTIMKGGEKVTKSALYSTHHISCLSPLPQLTVRNSEKGLRYGLELGLKFQSYHM